MSRGLGSGAVPGAETDEAGAATVWALALLHLILLAALVSSGAGGLALTRQRAATVADIAALAGAQAVADPCGAAHAAASANGMELPECRWDGTDLVVTVRANPPAVVGRLAVFLGRDPAPVTASARAGAPP